jgi:hypothetical protein
MDTIDIEAEAEILRIGAEFSSSSDGDLVISEAALNHNWAMLNRLGRHPNLYDGPLKVPKIKPNHDDEVPSDELSSDDSEDDIVKGYVDNKELKKDAIAGARPRGKE